MTIEHELRTSRDNISSTQHDSSVNSSSLGRLMALHCTEMTGVVLIYVTHPIHRPAALKSCRSRRMITHIALLSQSPE